MGDCVFCKIAEERQESESVIFEDDHVIALIALHQKPNNLGHALLFPKLISRISTSFQKN